MELIKKNIPIIISLIIAIIAGFLVYKVVNSMNPTVPVVIAKDNILVGTTIESNMLTVTNYPAMMVPNTSFGSINEVVGTTVINGPIVNGSIIRSENLSDDSALMASLKTYTEGTWTAVELPPGGALGMSGLRRGDKVDIYSDVSMEGGKSVNLVCENAIILEKPVKDKSDQFIVAVPKEFAPAVAELIVRNKPITLTLNNTMEIVQESLPVEPEENSEETSEETEETPEENTEGGNE